METRRHNERTKTEMVGTCHTNGGLQNTSPGYTVGVERIQEEARTTKDKLDGHRETQPENMDITWKEAKEVAAVYRTQWRQRVAQYATNRKRDEQNRTEQQNSIFYFVF